MVLQTLASFVQDHSHILADDPPPGSVTQFNPGLGTPPPGSGKFMAILGWVAWGVTGLCVAGILFAAGKMAISHRRGEGGEHATGLAWVLGASILIGTASLLVGTLATG